MSQLRARISDRLPAWDLLLLLAAREARELGVSDGTLHASELEDWEASLPESDRAGLNDFDRLVQANHMHLRVRRGAAGV